MIEQGKLKFRLKWEKYQVVDKMVKVAIFAYEYWQVSSGLEIIRGKITLSNYHFWEN
ncbi:Lysosomal alpha-mannosidase [Gossypium arboreum]|uniref:Lysosomal alpha-mannosidase n=1 Tax=Gossypium arboreum TaxID=29729 RepID=A0A0B0P2N0_GOSAR|nr:Lysosomal alpha-mannosidase [Gossypium arboreum]